MTRIAYRTLLVLFSSVVCFGAPRKATPPASPKPRLDILVLPGLERWETYLRIQGLPASRFVDFKPAAIPTAALDGIFEASAPRIQEWHTVGTCPDVSDEPTGVIYPISPDYADGALLHRSSVPGVLGLPEPPSGLTVPVTLVFLTHSDKARITSSPTARMPSGAEIPSYVIEERETFYEAVLETAFQGQGNQTALVEGVGALSACAECRAGLPDRSLLLALGAAWVGQDVVQAGNPFGILLPGVPPAKLTRYRLQWESLRKPMSVALESSGVDAGFTRFRVREGSDSVHCGSEAAVEAAAKDRAARQAMALAKLTGWPLARIAERSGVSVELLRARPDVPEPQESWWKRLKALFL